MTRFHLLLLTSWLGFFSVAFPSLPLGAAEPTYRRLFNGNDLDGWKGLDSLWTVRDGVILGQTSRDKPIEANTFLVWQGGEVGDFEFLCDVRFEGVNSGVQYRSTFADEENLALTGYQADLHPKPNYMGMMYGEKTGRGIIASGGQRVVVSAQGETKVVDQIARLANPVAEEWNELRIIAIGNRMIHQINGTTTVDVTDDHPDARLTGLLGLQLHRGAPMKAEFRNLRLRELSGDEGKRVLAKAIATTALAASSKATDTTTKQKRATPKDADNTKSMQTPRSEWLLASPVPEWIWADHSSANQRVWFRHSFELPEAVESAEFYGSCDNQMELFINGRSAGRSKAWQTPLVTQVSEMLKKGKNVVAVAGENEGGTAALVAKLSIKMLGGEHRDVVTTSQWKLSENEARGWQNQTFDDSKWAASKSIKKLGNSPWGVPGKASEVSVSGKPTTDSADREPNIVAAPGFVVERIYTVASDQGSWVSLTTDPKGRLYACDQGKEGLYRLTLQENEPPLVEKVSTGALSDLTGAQGLEWAFDSLWFHKNGGNLIRVSDADGDDVLDTMETIPGGTGGGEHGNHGVITTEDGTGLYLDGGNAAPIAEYSASRVPIWSEGLLLPRMWDAKGHARGRLAPAGWITRLDPQTNEQTVHSIGYRNQYDLTLNRYGDLFTYDADMEWDLGLPWYRPTRICLAASGSDYGWRSGAGKWPTYYEDTLPPVVEIGPGSPTGLISGGGTTFPTKYQDALFALDWTYGTMYAIHLIPDGAGYRGEVEHFVYGSPLPLTDAAIGNDGSMYFTVGGRQSQSALYRIRYEGDASCEAPTKTEAAAFSARQQRRLLETFHGVANPDAVATAWPSLSSRDRFLRHAARIAIESQPVESWVDRIATETDPQSRITASVALARMGDAEHREPLIQTLLQLNVATLEDSQLLGMLRAYALAFIELGARAMTNAERSSNKSARYFLTRMPM